MFQSKSFHIQQATILFYSHHYNHLKCRIVKKSASTILSSKLISNCLETAFNINCDLEDFTVQLWQAHVLVANFSFTPHDLDEVMNQSDNNQKTKYSFKQAVKKRRKYIKFKKENDCLKDLICVENTNFNGDILYEDFIRNIAQKVCSNLEIKAINRIKKIEKIKLRSKKLSLQMCDPILIKKTTLESNLLQVKQVRYQSSGEPENHNQINNKQQILKQAQFSRTWMGLQSPASNQSRSCKGSNTFIQMKNEYKLRKVRQKVKKMFHKQIQQKRALEMIVIPQIKTTKMNVKTIRLLSQGIIVPRRTNSEAIQDLGIKFQGFLDKNYGQNPKQNNFSSQIFRLATSDMNVRRDEMKIKNKYKREKSQKQRIKEHKTKQMKQNSKKKLKSRIQKKESTQTQSTDNFKRSVKFR